MVDYVSPAQSTAAGRRRDAIDAATFARRLDWVLVAAVAGLVGFGLWAIAGITEHDVPGNPDYYLTRQGLYAAAGVVGLLAVLLIDPERIARTWKPIFFGTCLMIAIVFAAGPIRGTKRWLDVGPFRFQPSEFGKLLFVLGLAGFLAHTGRRIQDGRTTWATVGLAAIPIALVFLQPDIGSALVYGAALLAMLFVAGTRWRHLATVVGGAALVASLVLFVLPAADVHLLKQYQHDRLTNFLDPSRDPGGATYNIAQSMNAIGAGGVRGRGVAGATQTNLDFLPEHHTDFAFASFAEQRGFVGCAILLALYLLVVWRGLRVVTVARDPFSAIVAGGIVFGFLFQVFVNVGMTMGIAPITGIPLPFVSVGGSSMIANLLGIGVLLSIHARARSRR
jgi:rod shape determining protein RodA